MKRAFLKFISRFLDCPIGVSYRVTTDDVQVNPEFAQRELEFPLSPITARYVLRPKNGSFELVSLDRKKDKVSYTVRHTVTGTVFSIEESVFQLLFRHSGVR